MSKRILAATAVRITSCLLAVCISCARSSRPIITFIPQTTADDLWEPAHTGALDATLKTGYFIHWNGPTIDTDIQAQITLVVEATNRHTAGIILAPDHTLALMIPIQRATSNGIPVVVIGSALPLATSSKLFYVVNNEEDEGQIAARRIGERLGGKGSVALLGLNPDDSGQFLRMRAFELTLSREFPNITVLSRNMSFHSEAQAEQTADNLLSSGRVPDAILGLTRVGTLGALHAIEAEKLTKRIILVGCDQNYSLLYYLSQGRIDSIIAENTYAMGYQAAQLILSVGTSEAPNRTNYVRPILVTRENMNSPELLNMLTHDARIPH